MIGDDSDKAGEYFGPADVWLMTPINARRDIATYMQYGLEVRSALRGGEPVAKPQIMLPGVWTLSGHDSDLERCQAQIDMARLSVRLRLLEHDSGPLTSQREKVAALAKEFPHVEIAWEGNIVLVQKAYDELSQSEYHSDPSTDEKAFRENSPPLRLAPAGSE